MTCARSILELVEHRGDVRRVHERPVRERRLAEAAKVAGDHAESAREHRHHVLPHRPIGDPGVQEHERWAVPGDRVRHVDAVDP